MRKLRPLSLALGDFVMHFYALSNVLAFYGCYPSQITKRRTAVLHRTTAVQNAQRYRANLLPRKFAQTARRGDKNWTSIGSIGTTTKKRRKVWGAWMYRLEAPSNSAFGRAIGSRKLKRNKVALQFRQWWRHIKLQRCYCCKIVATGIKKG